MSVSRLDAVVIGSGLEELVAAATIADAGRRVLVLEPGESVGGPAAGEELLPGYRIDPVFADAGFLDPRALDDHELDRHGVALLAPDPFLAAPAERGDPLVLWRDIARSRAAIGRRSAVDGDRWAGFAARMESFARVLEELGSRPPIRPAGPFLDLAPFLGLGRRIRALGRERMAELFRVLPLPAWDLLEDEFRDPLLKGALAATSVRGVFQGPRSPGTALALLHHHVGSPAGVFGLRTVVRGGVGRLAEALAAAARARGVEIRLGAPVERIAIENGRATGVALEGGEEIVARVVLSGADPRRTFLDLAGTDALDPDFVHAVRQIRFRGGFARLHLALSEAPRFDGIADPTPGIVSIAADPDHVERAYDDAKHGDPSARPVLEARIPSLADPALAPEGRHVMSVDVRFVPLGDEAPGDAARDALADRAIELLAERAPDLPASILGRRLLLPADLEERHGLTGGDPFQGELALDQLLFMRPVAGWASYRTPIPALYLCGPGTHPAGAITGASGRHAANAILEDLEVRR